MSSRPRRRVFRPGDAAEYDREADRPVSDPSDCDEYVIVDDENAPDIEEEAVDRLLRDRPPHWG